MFELMTDSGDDNKAISARTSVSGGDDIDDESEEEKEDVWLCRDVKESNARGTAE